MKTDFFNTYRSIVKQAGLWDATKATGRFIGGTTKNTLDNLNPANSDVDNTAGYNIAKTLTEFFLPKAYNPENTGPYDEYTEFLKDTEEGDQYLREAAKLRRRARILLKQIEEEEKNKRHAAKSRYF